MSKFRLRRYCLRLVSIAALVAIGACHSQRAPATTSKESPNMSPMPPSASRPAAREVEPIEYKGIRYVEDRVDASQGDQNGGYLAAIDPGTGDTLWRLKVYDVPDYSAAGVPSMGRYFRSMRLVPGSDAIEIENEAGGRYVVDLQHRTSTQVGGPAPAGTPATAPKPKPKPSPD